MDTCTLSGISSGNKVEMFEYAEGYSPAKDVEKKMPPKSNPRCTTTATSTTNRNGNGNSGKTPKRPVGTRVHVSIGTARALHSRRSLPLSTKTSTPKPNNHNHPTPMESLAFAVDMSGHDNGTTNAKFDSLVGDNRNGNRKNATPIHVPAPKEPTSMIVYDYTHDDDDDDDDDDAPMTAPLPKQPTKVPLPDNSHKNEDDTDDDDDGADIIIGVDDDDDDDDSDFSSDVDLDAEVVVEEGENEEESSDEDDDDDEEEDPDEDHDEDSDDDNNNDEDEKGGNNGDEDEKGGNNGNDHDVMNNDDNDDNVPKGQSKTNFEAKPDDTPETSRDMDSELQQTENTTSQQYSEWTDRDAQALVQHLKNQNLHQYPPNGFDWSSLCQLYPHQTKDQIINRVQSYFECQKESKGNIIIEPPHKKPRKNAGTPQWTENDDQTLEEHIKIFNLEEYPRGDAFDWSKLCSLYPHFPKDLLTRKVYNFFRRQIRRQKNEQQTQKDISETNSDDTTEASRAVDSEPQSQQSRLTPWTDRDAEDLKQHLENYKIHQYPPRGYNWSTLYQHFPHQTRSQIVRRVLLFFKHDQKKSSKPVVETTTEESNPDPQALSTETISDHEATIPPKRQRKRVRRYSDTSENEPAPPKKRSSAPRNDQNTTTTTTANSSIESAAVQMPTRASNRSTTSTLPTSDKTTNAETDREPYELTPDPNQFYVEEEAYLYHNPPLPSTQTQGVLPVDLKPIPPPPPPPTLFPNTGKCTWSFDAKNRIFLADFSKHDNLFTSIDPEDEKLMLHIMERDDVTLISQGLLDTKSIDPSLWTIQNIGASLNQDFFHRFRRFDTKILKDGTEKIFEVDVPYSMKIIDYCRYLDQRAKYFKNTKQSMQQGEGKDNDNDKDKDDDKKFVFTNHLGKEFTINVAVSALYLIDMDIKKLLPELHDDFRSAFRFPSALPGGRSCMMNKVTPDARPFMGPNLYITPPASFTHFHQDGHGTVDSGHLVISGYNEVVLLRRLTERHKRHALWLLTGLKEHADKATQTFLDGLYSEPHSDGLGEKPSWPSKDRIEMCREMGYCPTIIMLKPGQFIHIGKGRLHAFRKMSNMPLPKDDCHYELREQVLSENNFDTEQLCVSIAWDWMFRGHTSRGIYREVVATLEAAILTRKRGRLSLAIPELALLRMAQNFAKPTASFTNLNGMFGSVVDPESSTDKPTDRVNVCRGILPGLRYVINEHLAAIDNALNDVNKSNQEKGRVSLAERPNSHENPELSAVDPHGNNDFSCKLCRKELSNVYYHCDGCEKLLNKDFNLCVSCHTNKYYARFVQVHPHNTKRHATINHVGDMRYDRNSRCICKNGPCCKECSYCLGCSCRCHTQFTLNFRLFDNETEQAILQRVEAVANSGNESLDDMEKRYLTDQAFTNRRLDDAKIAWGHSDEYIL